MKGEFDRTFQSLTAAHRSGLWWTAVFSAGVAVAAVTLLGLSGWFLTAAAAAGAAGVVAAQAFNYLFPSAAIRALAIGRTGLRYAERLTGHEVALRAMARLRPIVFARILKLSPGAALTLRRGDATAGLVQGVTVLETSLVMRSVGPGAAAGMIAAVTLAAIGQPRAAFVLAGALFLGWATVRFLLSRLAPPSAENADLAALKARFHGLMDVLPDILTLDSPEPLCADLRRLEAELIVVRGMRISREAATNAATMVLTGFCLPLMGWVSDPANLPGLALTLLAGSVGFESLGQLARALSHNDEAQSAHSHLSRLCDSDEAVMLPAADALTFAGQAWRLDRDLRLLIAGPSGSGKTQLAETLLNLREAAVTARDVIAWQPQDAAVLTGSLRHNLTLAGGVDDATIWNALSDACLDDRVRSLPGQLETWVGDGGIALSGGERKRLALARAYLRPAAVLLLDEPTEGLDPATEARVVERLDARLQNTGQGLILISHRLAPRRLTTQRLDVIPPGRQSR